MAVMIKFNRGVETNLPTLAEGEPAFCTDSYKMFIGDGTTNREVITPNSTALDSRYYTETESDSRYIRRDASSNPDADDSYDIGDSSHRFSKIYAVEFNGTSTSSKYADIAEKYTIKDKVYNHGDVVLVSRRCRVTDAEISNEEGSNRVIGVITTKPAVKMNSDLKNGVYVALKGRVPCKVQGPVRKGDSLVSYYNGCAIKATKENVLFDTKIFGIANESILGDNIKIIEIVL